MRIAQTLFEKGTKALPFQEKVNTLHSAFSASLANALQWISAEGTLLCPTTKMFQERVGAFSPFSLKNNSFERQ